MAKIKIPYSTTFVDAEIPDENLIAVLESKAHHFVPDVNEEQLVERALDNPIDSESLEELVKGKKNMVIITSDHTRPVPSKVTLPIVLRRIRKVNPNIDITILIATGFHRATTHQEMLNKFGEEIVNNEKLVNHVSWDKHDMKYVGILPSGGELWLNKLVMETELLIFRRIYRTALFCRFFWRKKKRPSWGSR